MREKFLFLDIKGWDQAAAAGFGSKLEVVIYLNHTVPRIEEWVDRHDVPPRLHAGGQSVRTDRPSRSRSTRGGSNTGSCPMWLFRAEWKSTRSTRSRASIPRPRRRPSIGRSIRFIMGCDRSEPHTFWHASRRNSTQEGDRGTEVFLQPGRISTSNRSCRPTTRWSCARLCTNRDLPNQLQHAGERLYFELEGAAPLTGIRCLKTPTSPLRAPGAPRPLLVARLASDAQFLVAGRPDRRPRRLVRDSAALRFQRSAGRPAAIGRHHAATDRGDRADAHAADHRPRGQPFGQRLLPRRGSHGRIRRREICRHRHVPLRLRAGAVLGALCRRSIRLRNSWPRPRNPTG